MADGARAFLALGGAALVALLTVPLARRLAIATDFLDRPRDYKTHGGAIPYLGGLGVMVAFGIVAGLLGDAYADIGTVMALAFGLCLMGSIDDRWTLSPTLRFALQLGAAALLWADGIRWEPFDLVLLDLPLTLAWVVGLTNAFNLLDNIDGAAGVTGAVSAAGIGAIALHEGSGDLAAVAFALSGACASFLLFNLTDRFKVFLGDGGSMPLGFLVAALAMLLPTGLGNVALLAAVPLAGVAIFDTSLVVLSRRRRGVGILTGGRDHSTHRLLGPLGTPRRVAVVLALAQGALGALAFVMTDLSEGAVLLVSGGYVALGVYLLSVFEGPALAPDAPALGPAPADTSRSRAATPSVGHVGR